MRQENRGFADTAFKENLGRPIHSWTPWIGGYSAEFVRGVIDEYGPHGRIGLILDPFCGVGTTLVEAVRVGHQAVGIELNPYAAMAATLKSSAQELDSASLWSQLSALESAWESLSEEREFPAYFGSREPFFPEANLRQINRILNWIDSIPTGLQRDFFNLALGSVLVAMSNYSYEPSLSTRTRSGRPPQGTVDALEIYKKRVQGMLSDIAKVEAEEPWGKAKIWTGSSLNGAWHLEKSSVDLVITSPPYLNNYHYVRNSRPQLFMLGLIKEYTQLQTLQDENFGKYWQTVRNRKFPEQFVKSDALNKVVQLLCAHKHEKNELYSGVGWAAYAIHYFNDSAITLERCFEALSEGGDAFFVLGDSYLQGIYVPVQDIFSEIAQSVGFSLVACQCVRKRHGGSTVRARRSTDSEGKFELSEYVVHLQKKEPFLESDVKYTAILKSCAT